MCDQWLGIDSTLIVSTKSSQILLRGDLKSIYYGQIRIIEPELNKESSRDIFRRLSPTDKRHTYYWRGWAKNANDYGSSGVGYTRKLESFFFFLGTWSRI